MQAGQAGRPRDRLNWRQTREWKIRRLEDWKIGRLEDWKIGMQIFAKLLQRFAEVLLVNTRQPSYHPLHPYFFFVDHPTLQINYLLFTFLLLTSLLPSFLSPSFRLPQPLHTPPPPPP